MSNGGPVGVGFAVCVHVANGEFDPVFDARWDGGCRRSIARRVDHDNGIDSILSCGPGAIDSRNDPSRFAIGIDDVVGRVKDLAIPGLIDVRDAGDADDAGIGKPDGIREVIEGERPGGCNQGSLKVFFGCVTGSGDEG